MKMCIRDSIRTNPEILVEFDVVTISDKKNIVDRLNLYFIDSIKEIVDKIPRSDGKIICEKEVTVKLQTFQEISKEQLKMVVFNLKKSSSPDESEAHFIQEYFKGCFLFFYFMVFEAKK